MPLPIAMCGRQHLAQQEGYEEDFGFAEGNACGAAVSYALILKVFT